jgi:hypothetical protein
MKYAIIENGVVTNVALADEALGINWIASDTAQIGWLYDGGAFTAPDIAQPTDAQRRAVMSCSKMQGILTLGEAAWGEVLTYRETASWAEQMVIDSAQDWNRTSQNIAFFGYLLDYTDAQMDAMFTAAAQVTA